MVLKNAYLGGELTDIVIEDGKIVFIGKSDNIDGETVDLEGKKVFAGLIDIHSHGAVGADVMDGGTLEKLSLHQVKNGITSWLPTTMTMDYDTIKSTTDESIDVDGAEILGFHYEGPYICKKYKGAQNEKFIKNPDVKEFETFKNAKMVSIAPELEGSMEFIEKTDSIVSIGHTDADYETAVKAMKKGAKCLTHTFNAMPPLHHRNPGVIGAAIEENAYVQVICDGLHIHKSVIKALYKIFGTERMVLISDSMRATGVSDGEYEFGGQKIIVRDMVAKTLEGAIAGSTTTLFGCVKKAIEFGISEEDAFKMASYTPAKLLGLENKGEIKVGADADIIAVDKDYNLVLSIAKGKRYV